MQTLTVATIQNVKAIAFDENGNSRPVFLVTMTQGVPLVVKAEGVSQGRSEQDAQNSIRWGSRMMKQVTPGVHVHPLSSDEVKVLGALRDDQFADDQSRPFLALCRSKAGNVWVKMDYVQPLADVESMIAGGAGALVLSILRSDRILKGLGRIAAVDLFLGNKDRFHTTINTAVNNIFLRQGGPSGYDLIGLDFYAAFVSGSNLCEAPPDDWEGRVLVDRAKLYQYSVEVIEKLNKTLGLMLKRAKTRYSRKDLICQYSTAFLCGIHEGAAVLKNYLERKNSLHSDGIAQRMKVLGW
jgi:hypothetical protein